MPKVEDIEARSTKAANATSPDVIAEFAMDSSFFVRLSAACNINASPSVLDHLSADANLDVVCAVAQNQSTSATTLEALSKSKVAEVVYCVAGNPSASPATLANIVQRAKIDPTGQHGVLPRRHQMTYGSIDFDILSALASNPNIEPTILRDIAFYINTPDIAREFYEKSNIRYWMAQNRNTPQDVLTSFTSDLDHSVRREVACNYNTPSEALAILAHDVQPYVKELVAQHPNTPERIKIWLNMWLRDEGSGYAGLTLDEWLEATK